MAISEALLANKIQVAIAGMVVLGGAGATYVALGGELPFLGADDMADQVPEDVDMVMYMDPSVTEDQTTKELVNGLIDISKEQQGEFYTGPDDYEEMMEDTESNSSLDMDKLNSLMLYAKYPENTSSTMGLPDDSYLGFIVDSEWSEDEFMNEVENGTEYEEDEYEGHTLYVQQNVSEDGSRGYIGVLEDGLYVLGTEDAVEDAIEVQKGSMKSFDGDLRKAYDDTRSGDNTYLKFAATFPDEEKLEQAGATMSSDQQFTAFTNIDVMAGSYYTSDEEIGMQMRLETGNEDDADDLASIVDGGVTTVKQSSKSEETQALLDEVEVEQDGTVVKMTFQSSTDLIIDAWEVAIENWGGTMGSTYGSDSGYGSEYGTESGYGALEASEPQRVPA